MDEEHLKIKKRLQDFQVRRLKRTFADFLKDKEFGSLCTFFTDHLYSPEDMAARNESFFKLVHAFERLLGKEILHSVSRLVEAHDLSDSLDDSVVEQFVEMGRGQDFDMEAYERAYYLADNYDERVEQIELLVEAVHTVHRIAFFPLIGILLQTLYAGAKVIGATPMVDFLRGGYAAMRSVKDPTKFTEAIREREMSRLNRIYGVTA